MNHQTNPSPLTSGTRTRRSLMLWSVRLAGGAVLAGGVGALGAGRAAAEDWELTLGGAGSQLTVGPGRATAQGAVAGAAAERGMARVQAAAALATADSDGETAAAGAAAFAAADPDRGAIAQGAAATTNALSDDDGGGQAPAKMAYPATIAPAPRGRGGRGGGRAGGGGGAGRGGGGRAGRGGGGGRERRRDQVGGLPDAGTGNEAQPVATAFGLASVAAAVGALFLRHRGEEVALATQTVARDN